MAKWEVGDRFWEASRGLLAAGAKARHAKPRSRGPSWAAMAEGKDKFWAEMSPKEQAAAKILGWDSVSIFSSS